MPNNTKVLLPLYQKYITDVPAELALTMIVRQFRFLILSLQPEESEFPSDFMNLAPWLRKKYQIQALRFGQDNLINIYAGLLLIDEQSKNGQSPVSLESRLELFLLTL